MMKRPFNPEEANAFLRALDREGVFTFQTFHDRIKGGGGRVLHGTFAQHQQALMRLNEEGHGVFVMVNKGDGIAHGNAKTCRTAANVVAVRALFVDLDGAPPEPVLAYQPDIVIESSQDRWHAYWWTRDFPLDKFTSCQQQLAKKFNPRWPVQIPPPVATPNSPRQDWPDYDDSVLMAMREAASLRR